MSQAWGRLHQSDYDCDYNYIVITQLGCDYDTL